MCPYTPRAMSVRTYTLLGSSMLDWSLGEEPDSTAPSSQDRGLRTGLIVLLVKQKLLLKP